MTYLPNSDFYYRVAAGQVPKHRLIHKFGYNAAANDADDLVSWEAAISWQTSADVLDVVSTSANDDVGSTGAAKIRIFGLDADFNEIDEIVEMDGVNPVTTTKSYIRCFRAFACDVGTYHGSNIGNITISYQTTTDVAAYIPAGAGQTEQAMYTVPANHTAHLLELQVHVDASKTAQIAFKQTPNAHIVTGGGAVPMCTTRSVLDFFGVVGSVAHVVKGPQQFPAKTDLWLHIADVGAAGTPISGQFELMLVENGT